MTDLCRIKMKLIGIYLFCVSMVYADVLPEQAESLTNTSSACFGTHTRFKPSCIHKPGTVIAVNALKVGSKLVDSNCSESVIDSDPVDYKCCFPNITADCIFNVPIVSWVFSLRPHRLCSGRTECSEASGALRADTTCPNPSYALFNYTTYMFMEFVCVPTSRIKKLPLSNETFVSTTDVIYLQTENYPDPFTSGDFQTSCNISADSAAIDVFTVDLRLGQENTSCVTGVNQFLKLSDGTKEQIWDCHHDGLFNITKQSFSNFISLEFESKSAANVGQAWVGFRGTNLTFDCIRTHHEREITTTTPAPVTHSNSTAGEPKDPDSTPSVGLIAGIVGGLVALIVVVIVAFLCKKCNTDKVAPQENGTQPQQPMNTFYSDTVSSAPPSGTRLPQTSSQHGSKLPTSNGQADTAVLSNTSRNKELDQPRSNGMPKLDNTRYIQEHGGLRNSLPPNRLQPIGETDNDVAAEKKKKKKKKKKKEYADESGETQNDTEGYRTFDNQTGPVNLLAVTDEMDSGSGKTHKKKKKKKKRHGGEDEDVEPDILPAEDGNTAIYTGDESGEKKKKKKKKKKHDEIDNDD